MERNWMTIKLLSELNDWPTESALRFMVFKSEENGLHEHIRRIGTRVLIDENGFWRWVELNGKSASSRETKMGWHKIEPEGYDGDDTLVCGDGALEVVEMAVCHLGLLWLNEHGRKITTYEIESVFDSVLNTLREHENRFPRTMKNGHRNDHIVCTCRSCMEKPEGKADDE